MECRTCLASGVELHKLEAPFSSTQIPNDAFQLHDINLSFLECLLFCTRLKNEINFPSYICIECCQALKISYIFITNAKKAHEILTYRSNARMLESANTDVIELSGSDEILEAQKEQQIPMKFRCKICQEKLGSKRDLKEHVKLHTDVITYRCQLCDFDCKKRTHLLDHYIYEHNVVANNEQLKPVIQNLTTEITDNNKSDAKLIKEEFLDNDNNLQKNKNKAQEETGFLQRLKERQREQAEAEKLLQELEERMLLEMEAEEETKKQKQITTKIETNEFMTEENMMPTALLDFTNIESNNSIALASDTNSDQMNVGDQFLVLPDGTLEKLNAADIVIQYIDNESINVTTATSNLPAPVPILDGNDLIVDNTVQIDAASNMDIAPMDFTEIVDESSRCITTNIDNQPSSSHMFLDTFQNETQNTISLANLDEKSNLNTKSSMETKQIHCKICNQTFDTQPELKIHMLGHSEIPHFFCDRCSFYTFFKNDLTQHFKIKHNVYPSSKQLKPKNKVNRVVGKTVYSCDLCLFETTLGLVLQQHYKDLHQVEATEVQLRPQIDNTNLNMPYMPVARRQRKVSCKLCKEVFHMPKEYREHLLWHKEEKKKEALMRLLDIEEEKSKIKNQNQQSQQKTPQQCLENQIQYTTTENSTIQNSDINININQYQNNDNNLTYNYSKIENNVILPMEAIPDVIGSEQTIEPDGMEFDFGADTIFEDFDNVNDGCEENDEELDNLVLTSEDDLDDLIEEHNSDDRVGSSLKNVQNNLKDDSAAPTQLSAYCVHCNKRFFSQYHFENHMFIHRGLAPYRCESCTNIYNTKRELIRHYKAVHKSIPTRDMIQAKGDKVNNTGFSILQSNFNDTKAGTLMCAKCPFESTELLNLQLHLTSTHGITDQNFVLQKLPFECPRCIRSYETKQRLLKHLERNHSTQPIMLQNFESTINNAANKPSTSTNLTISSHQQTVDSTTTTLKEQQQQISTTITSGQHQQQQEQQAKVKIKKIDKKFWQHPDDFNNLNLIDEFPTSPTTIAATSEINATKTETSSTISSPPTTSGTQDSSFICKICHGTYKSEFLLKFHMKRHTERNFRCELCPKSFITRSDLMKHKTLHTGDLAHECDICQKKFGYSHHLKRHRDTVHFNKRFRCLFSGCNKNFSNKSQLTKHERDHSGTWQFKCPYCQRPFNRRENLRQHARKIHNIQITEAEIADIFRKMNGYTNPHDLIVAADGQYMRRSDMEALVASSSTISNDQTFAVEEEVVTEEIDFNQANDI